MRGALPSRRAAAARSNANQGCRRVAAARYRNGTARTRRSRCRSNHRQVGAPGIIARRGRRARRAVARVWRAAVDRFVGGKYLRRCNCTHDRLRSGSFRNARALERRHRKRSRYRGTRLGRIARCRHDRNADRGGLSTVARFRAPGCAMGSVGGAPSHRSRRCGLAQTRRRRAGAVAMTSAPLSYDAWVGDGKIVTIETKTKPRRIFVRQSGIGDDAMLFLHGFPTSSWDWCKIEPLLGARYRLYFFDFLGFGASDKPRDHRYDLREQADIAEAVARYFRIERARLVAHDYGSSVAQELLARNADRALSFELLDVTLLNGGIYPDLHRPVRLQKLLRSPFGPLVARLANEKRLSAALSAVFSSDHQPTRDELAQHWQAIA